ncbi:MAG: peptidoglycan D,D-transpeptidase FtsI family protein [Candidatus Aminicenantales bacterium]
MTNSPGRVEKRAIITAVGLALWFVLIAARLVQLQVFKHRELKTEAIEQNQYVRDVWPTRGTITDRHGNLLARSLPFPSLFLTTDGKESRESVARKIKEVQQIIPLSAKEIQRIRNRVENGNRFIWIKRKIPWEYLERLQEIDIPGVFLQTESKRFYPFGSYLAHVLGAVDIDDQGLSGIEYKYNQLLQGKKGRVLVRRDALRRKYGLEILEPAIPGADLVLTIDSTIQYIAERELERAVYDNQASWGTVIVSHPPSGEILAMASYPDYDPNYYPPADPLAQVNRAIQENFEPGSAFKIVTAAAALESGKISLNRVYDCSAGYFSIGGLAIRDYKRFNLLTFPEVFIHSSNVGTIQVAMQLGEDYLYEMIKKFRFGEKTGIDLPGEEAGILRPTRSWTIHTLPHISVGYEISVTAIQLLQALNILANRGELVPPRLVKAINGPDGTKPVSAPLLCRVMTAERAAYLVESIFSKVVEEGTGTAAKVFGFPAAGKTGTAQKFDPISKAYSSSRHRSIFLGFIPVDKPRVSIIIVIDEPKSGRYYGGDVAAPVFREIASQVLLYLKESPRIPVEKWVMASHKVQAKPEDGR